MLSKDEIFVFDIGYRAALDLLVTAENAVHDALENRVGNELTPALKAANADYYSARDIVRKMRVLRFPPD